MSSTNSPMLGLSLSVGISLEDLANNVRARNREIASGDKPLKHIRDRRKRQFKQYLARTAALGRVCRRLRSLNHSKISELTHGLITAAGNVENFRYELKYRIRTALYLYHLYRGRTDASNLSGSAKNKEAEARYINSLVDTQDQAPKEVEMAQ